MNRIALGTVQFGMDYGISNKEGKTPEEEASLILEEAVKAGIDTFDTAYNYGQSERLLGVFMKRHKDVKVISKLPRCAYAEVEKTFSISCSRLAAPGIYGYLIHDFASYNEDKRVWDELRKIKKSGRAAKIGFSLYRTQDLDELINNGVDFDIVQIPYSVFDRRFCGYFDTLKKSECEIYARSIFLQGLIFMDPSGLPGNLSKARTNLEKLNNIAAGAGISLNALCLNYVLSDRRVDKAVIGVNNLRQLKDNLLDIKPADRLNSVYGGLDALSIEDEDVLLPYRWQTR